MCIPSVRFNTTSVSRISSERPLEKINDLTICKAGLGKFSGGFRKRCTNCSEVSCTSVTTPNRWETSEITFWGPTKKMMLKHESNEASEHSPYHHKEHTLITCLYYIYIYNYLYIYPKKPCLPDVWSPVFTAHVLMQRYKTMPGAVRHPLWVLCRIQVCGCCQVSGFCGKNPRKYDSGKPVTIPKALSGVSKL